MALSMRASAGRRRAGIRLVRADDGGVDHLNRGIMLAGLVLQSVSAKNSPA